MKKPSACLLTVITLVFCAFTLGLFLGRTGETSTITVNVPASIYIPPAETSAPKETSAPAAVSYPLDINRASKEELMTLPGIGETLAQRILQYRKEQGKFISVDQLTMVEGIGEKRLEEILSLIKVVR